MYAGVWLALAALLAGDVGEDMFGAISRGGGCVRHAPRPEIGHLVVIKDLADVHLAFKGTPTTAVLEQRRHPPPDRPLRGGLRITTRCEQGCCVDGLMAADKVLLAPELDADDRRTCRNGWVDRVVRVAFQDRAVVSVYVARSWFDAGAAHANDQLRCRSFDLATGRPLKLGDVLERAEAQHAIDRTRRALRGGAFADFTLTPAGIRFQPGPVRGHDVQFCAEGRHPAKSDQILEIYPR